MNTKTSTTTPQAVTPLGHYVNGMTKYSNCQQLEDCINQHERSGWWAALDADVDFLVDDGLRTYNEREADELNGRQYHTMAGPQHA